MRRLTFLWIIPAAVAGLALFVFVGGTVVQVLWNFRERFAERWGRRPAAPTVVDPQ